MPEHKHSIHSRLEVARKALLDLSARNTLLNYRSSKIRGAEISSESLTEIFRAVVHEKKWVAFLPTQNESQHKSNQGQQDDQAILKLKTPYPPAKLYARLLATYYAYRTFIEEQGANILFLAFGMLNWLEADNSQECRQAPLILAPVELSRTNAQSKFQARYTDEDISENLSLRAKLSEFNVGLPPMPSLEELRIDDYFDAITETVKAQSEWVVDRSAIVLGFFSFGKFLMYRDLDVSVWPSKSSPVDHPIMKALLQDGFHRNPLPIGETDHLDKHLKFDALKLVVDADSSQTLAIYNVQQGKNLVIQGPPGTGKSQTITNIIADAIGNGKRVLFVSEKMAALGVVKRRLDKIGLGDACFELHSNKTNKKTLLKELERTLQTHEPILHRLDTEIKSLEEILNRLNAYCEAVNTPIGESEISPHRAIGELSKIRQNYPYANFSSIKFTLQMNWQNEQFARKQILIEELQSKLTALGIPNKHPFWGSKLKVSLPNDEKRLQNLLSKACEVNSHLQAILKKLAESLRYPLPQSRTDTEKLQSILQVIADAPNLLEVNIKAKEWITRHKEIIELLRVGKRINEIYDAFNSVLTAEAWKQNLKETQKNLMTFGHAWRRFLSRDYRKAAGTSKCLFRSKTPIPVEQRIKSIDAILEAQDLAASFRKGEALGKFVFGKKWRRGDSDWNTLESLSKWLFALHPKIVTGAIPESVLSILANEPSKADVQQDALRLQSIFNEHTSLLQDIANALLLDENIRQAKFDQGFAVVGKTLSQWLENFDELQALIAYNRLKEICLQEELEPIVTIAESWPEAKHQLLPLFQSTWYESLLERAYRERNALQNFDEDRHRLAITKFRELDKRLLENNQKKIAHSHWQRVAGLCSGAELQVLKREFQKKSRHLSIRQLIAKAGIAIQKLKPVFMMSPLSIATYLSPESLEFDLVVFDEASQVQPVDAFGAILRGKQVVVVGDTQQLPPINRYDHILADGDESEENATSDLESILGLFLAQGAPEKMLRWHYRSQHEALIAVSNRFFYESRLVLFPSPDNSKTDLGLKYHYLPNTCYERGKSKTNPKEAKAVAEAVMQHARVSSKLTLGVVAFSMAQMQAIDDQLELLKRADPSCENFFSSNPHEPFFNKNLENVQGDERDVIFISIGYGHDENKIVSMNFGPLNNAGGERRLNVLISRARKRCEVFTNLTANDIDLNRSKARGIEALKMFLEYAQTGRLEIAVATEREADSPFETAVAQALRNVGYIVKHQVGLAGFFIDLAIVDPDRPGLYVLGIECDGATYHSARSARDRDRLRQQILENLGWQIHRIWSTDWFRTPERELKRVVQAIETAKNYITTARLEVNPISSNS